MDYEAMTHRMHQRFLPGGLSAALDDTPFHQDVANKALLAEASFLMDSNHHRSLFCSAVSGYRSGHPYSTGSYWYQGGLSLLQTVLS
ncbi:MAG: hypothetical protein ACSLEN_05350 [Candidatus Malihini olakiniferum]